jgi:hypothetical protein
MWGAEEDEEVEMRWRTWRLRCGKGLRGWARGGEDPWYVVGQILDALVAVEISAGSHVARMGAQDSAAGSR